jgi:hypothetical protein
LSHVGDDRLRRAFFRMILNRARTSCVTIRHTYLIWAHYLFVYTVLYMSEKINITYNVFLNCVRDLQTTYLLQLRSQSAPFRPSLW